MAYFVMETNPPGDAQAADGSLAAIAGIIEAAGGRVLDCGTKRQILILIVEIESERLMADLLEASASCVDGIRRVFLLESRADGTDLPAPSFAGLFGGMDLRDTVAVEIYPP